MKQAVGFDETRGDTISVVELRVPTCRRGRSARRRRASGENPQLWNIARQVLGAALVLVLAYFVLRPMMQVLTRPQPVAPAPAAVEYAAQMYPTCMAGGRADGPAVSYDDRMAAARSVAGQDPRQVAQVVRNWVAEDNG